MSLKISNKATVKQLELLKTLEYSGMGKYVAENLTIQEADKIIDELFIEQKYTYGMIRDIADDYYNFPNDINNAFGPRTGENT